MSECKQLGRIKTVFFGLQDGRAGVWFELGGDGWGTMDGAHWWLSGARSIGSIWTEEDRNAARIQAVERIEALIKQAKVDELGKLIGIPVEVTFNGNTLKEWRILTEVL